MADAYPELAVDPTDDELARDWTLSEIDLEEVLRSRGVEHRHRFAVQLCALRALGRFIDDFADVPVRIANHIGRQLGLLRHCSWRSRTVLRPRRSRHGGSASTSVTGHSMPTPSNNFSCGLPMAS